MGNGTKLDLSDWLILAAILFYIWYMFFPDLPKKCLKDGCDNYRDEKEIFCDYHIKKDEEKRQESYERMQKLKEWEKNKKKPKTTAPESDKNYKVPYSGSLDDIYGVHSYSSADDFADEWEDDFDDWDDAFDYWEENY